MTVLLLFDSPASAAPTDPQQTGGSITLPLAAALAVLGTLLLGVVTALILLRRRVASGFAAVARLIKRLAEPARRRRLLAKRREMSQHYAADGESVRQAHETFGEAADVAHAVRVDHSGADLWLSGSDSLDKPWKQVGESRWRRPTTAWGATPEHQPVLRKPIDCCLVRAGSDAGGTPTFVDLSRLDGVLSIVGDPTVAVDALRNVLAEVSRLRRGLPLIVLRTDGDVPIDIPAGLTLRPEPPIPPRPPESQTPVRGVAGRQPVKGLVIATGIPNQAQKDALMGWCGRRGGGWTGLVCGDIGTGAHWRWDVDRDGGIDIPILKIKLTVPARIPIS